MTWKSPNRDPVGSSRLPATPMDIFRRRIAGRLFGPLLLAAALSLDGFPQEPAVEVRQVAPETLDAEPGRILSVAFRVTNRSGDRVPLRESVLLPEGWQLVMPPLDFELEPAESVTRMAVLRVGRAAPAGEYEVVYEASGRAEYAMADRAAARVRVTTVYGLQLLLENRPPEQVAAGQSFSLHVRLINQGNAGLDVTLAATMGSGGRATPTPESFHLPAGSSRLVDIAAMADPGEDRLRRSHVHLTARTDTTAAGRPVDARLSVPVQVVPRVAGQDMYLRYPVELFARLGGDDEDAAFQFGLKGSGYLDEGRKRRLELFIQAPDRHDKGTLGRRDEFWIRYDESPFSFKAGDLSYALSELTSWHRYGRGAGLGLVPGAGPVRAGVYFVKDRWALQRRSDIGAHLSFAPNPETTLRANYLALDYEAWSGLPAARDSVFSLQAETRLLDHRLEAEMGWSTTNGPDAGRDTAWRLELGSPAGPGVRYGLSARRTGTDFAGRYPDSASYSGSFSLPLASGLRLHGAYDRYERNLAADSGRGAAPREDRYQAGLDARMAGRWYASLEYDLYDREDGASPPAYRFREYGVTLSAGRTGGLVSYRAEARRGQTRDRLTGRDYGGWNTGLYGTFTPHHYCPNVS